MKPSRLYLLAFTLLYAGSVAADPIFTTLQFAHDFGSRPSSRLSLKLTSIDADDTRRSVLALPLYSTDTSDPDGYRMHSAEQRRPLCERNPNGCLAFGLLLGVAIAYFVVEAVEDTNGDTRISFTSGSTRAVVNNAR